MSPCPFPTTITTTPRAPTCNQCNNITEVKLNNRKIFKPVKNSNLCLVDILSVSKGNYFLNQFLIFIYIKKKITTNNKVLYSMNFGYMKLVASIRFFKCSNVTVALSDRVAEYTDYISAEI